jgi:hypothetical protein
VVASSSNYNNYAVADINLDQKVVHLGYNEAKLEALKKKYGREVSIHDPGLIGSVLVTSEKKDVSAGDMLKEFKIEDTEDYFNRSRQVRTDQINRRKKQN